MICIGKRVALAIAAIIFLTFCGGNHPSDSDLEALFRSHSEAFATILGMMKEDSNLVQTVWLAPRATSPQNGSLSEERWREYDKLCGPLGIWRISLLNDRLELFVSSIGLLDRGSLKGFLYSEAPPDPIVSSLDLPASTPGSAYKPLSGGWYIFYQGPDE